MGGVTPLVIIAKDTVDCGFVRSSTARWSYVASCLYHGVSSTASLLCLHLVMVKRGDSLVVIADSTATTELSSMFCKQLHVHVCAPCVQLFMVHFMFVAFPHLGVIP